MKETAALLAAAAQCFGLADESLHAGERNEGIRARLEQCLPAPSAMACYEQTLWMTSFFASKRNGVPLERTLRGYPAPFEGLIEQVYSSDQDEYAFRRDWFAGCVGEHR